MLVFIFLKHGYVTGGLLKLKSQRKKEVVIKNPNKFKTSLDDQGRTCTKCLEYKTWDNYFVSNKTKTGYQSECKKCRHDKRRGRRDFDREKYCAKKQKQKVKKENPVLFKARGLRSRLLSRTKDPGIKQTTPTIPELEKWLTRDQYICYYSGEVLTLDNLTVDHKTPIKRSGTNELSNLCICSNHMNTAKGTMTELEFTELLMLIRKWEDRGERLLRRLKQGYF
jgi:5-methylcytosine-specific restriction endonuclease McrA